MTSRDEQRGNYVSLEQEIDGLTLEAELKNGVVEYVVIEGEVVADLTPFFREPYMVEELIEFLRAVQKEEK